LWWDTQTQLHITQKKGGGYVVCEEGRGSKDEREETPETKKQKAEKGGGEKKNKKEKNRTKGLRGRGAKNWRPTRKQGGLGPKTRKKGAPEKEAHKQNKRNSKKTVGRGPVMEKKARGEGKQKPGNTKVGGNPGRGPVGKKGLGILNKGQAGR